MNRSVLGVPLMVAGPVLAAIFVVIALFAGQIVTDITADTMMREVVQCSAAVNTAIGNSMPTFFYIGIVAAMVAGGFFFWRNGMGSGGPRIAAMVGLAFLVGMTGSAVSPAQIAYAETPCVLVDGTRAITGNTTLNDDVLLRLGTDGDIVQLNRSTILAADAELASVIVGTSNTPGVAANSLILSNITQDGDIMVAVNNGGNSIGVALVDASAGQTEFNPAAADWNFVVQSGSNAQMLAVDGGTNSVRIGGNNIADTGSLLVYAKPSIASSGSPSHSWWTSSTTTVPEAAAYAITYGAYYGQTTWAGTAGGVGETITDASTVYILGPAIQGADMTLSNPYSLWVDSGATRLDGTLTASGGGSLTGTWSDLGVVTTVDVNGGTLDGVTIGGAAAGAGTFTALNLADNAKIVLGTGSDAEIYFDASDLIINPKQVGTGIVYVGEPDAIPTTGADTISVGGGMDNSTRGTITATYAAVAGAPSVSLGANARTNDGSTNFSMGALTWTKNAGDNGATVSLTTAAGTVFSVATGVVTAEFSSVDINGGTIDGITSLAVDADLAFTGAQAITTSAGALTLTPFDGSLLFTGTLALTGSRVTQSYHTNITSTNAVTVDSSLESKVLESIVRYDKSALDILRNVDVIEYKHLHYLDPSDQIKLGMVAESFSEPLALSPIAKPEGGTYPGINMQAVSALQTKAIQELDAEVQALKAEIQALRANWQN